MAPRIPRRRFLTLLPEEEATVSFPSEERRDARHMAERWKTAKSFKEWLETGIQKLQAAGIRDAGTDAWLLMEYVANITRSFYYMHMHDPMEEGDAREYQRLLEERSRHIPVQYLTGEAWFYGYSFRVNSHVLIPRQDTEVLVEEALKRLIPGMHLLDLCTGSGCILLSLLKEASVSGVGADISQEALAVAEMNRKRLGVRAGWIQSDLFEHIGGRFHMILSNPPYIPSAVIPQLEPEVCQQEPILALDGHEDGLYFYRRIVEEAGDYLYPEGWLCLEIGYDQGPALEELLKTAGYEEISIVPDLAGLDRVALGRRPRQ